MTARRRATRPASAHRLVPRPGHAGPDRARPGSAHVVVHGWPVLVVVHDNAGRWHLLPDHPEHATGVPTDAGPAVTLADLARGDPTLAELEGLPRGWIASRGAPHRPWSRRSG